MKHLWWLPLLLVSCSPHSNPTVEYFLAQAPADPGLRIEDAYKWLFHATRGGEHAVENEFAVRKWLDQEWATLGPPQPDEPLWVPLTPDGRMGRLNLRPYRAQGGSPDVLHAAFLCGAQTFDASPTRFRAAWQDLGRALRQTSIGHLTRAEWDRLDLAMSPLNYPAIHHSAEYEQSRHPAYRVLPAQEAQQCIETLRSP